MCLPFGTHPHAQGRETRQCQQAGPRHITGKDRLLPIRLAETFTISPENLEGSMFLGESMAFKENFSASGKKPVWESLLLTNSLWSTWSSSSVVLAIWYTVLGCSG